MDGISLSYDELRLVVRIGSAKSKGRRFQQYVAQKLVEFGRGLLPDDVRSASMGAPGEDILLSPAARKQFPYSIECKNVEKLSIWAAVDQARANCPDGALPVVAFTRNREENFICIKFEHFLELHRRANEKNAD